MRCDDLCVFSLLVTGSQGSVVAWVSDHIVYWSSISGEMNDVAWLLRSLRWIVLGLFSSSLSSAIQLYYLDTLIIYYDTISLNEM
jgi:hypothetical protein